MNDAGATRLLERLRGSEDPSLRTLFAPDAPLIVARAPGRLDVMGGIADYSGSLVLQLPLAVSTTAIIQPSADDDVDVVSLRDRWPARFSIPLRVLSDGPLRDTDALRRWFAAHARDRWAAYVIGVLHALLMRDDTRSAVRGGFRLLVASEVPEGKGVSSSAALEVACLSAIAARYGIEMRGEEIARASQWAENHVAGAPCGIMDQMTSACGRRDRLLRLRCQPDVIEGHVPIPAGYRFVGVDSGVRHTVSGSDYGTVRTAAFMGYRIIADAAGVHVPEDPAAVRESDALWRGYLANLTPAQLEAEYLRHLPEQLQGAEFLARYGGITDTVTRVDPARTYPVRQATVHPIYENARVERFAELLRDLRAGDDARACAMGRLMAESHASYSACGLGSEATDELVARAEEAGPARGVFGAKITGGGSGGTVALLVREDAEAVVRELAGERAVFWGSGEAELPGTGQQRQ